MYLMQSLIVHRSSFMVLGIVHLFCFSLGGQTRGFLFILFCLVGFLFTVFLFDWFSVWCVRRNQPVCNICVSLMNVCLMTQQQFGVGSFFSCLLMGLICSSSHQVLSLQVQVSHSNSSLQKQGFCCFITIILQVIYRGACLGALLRSSIIVVSLIIVVFLCSEQKPSRITGGLRGKDKNYFKERNIWFFFK